MYAGVEEKKATRQHPSQFLYYDHLQASQPWVCFGHIQLHCESALSRSAKKKEKSDVANLRRLFRIAEMLMPLQFAAAVSQNPDSADIPAKMFKLSQKVTTRGRGAAFLLRCNKSTAMPAAKVVSAVATTARACTGDGPLVSYMSHEHRRRASQPASIFRFTPPRTSPPYTNHARRRMAKQASSSGRARARRRWCRPCSPLMSGRRRS